MGKGIDLLIMDYIDITDAYLGDLIEDIASKHYPNIDLHTEYGDLLEYISEKLIEGLFKDEIPDPSTYERKLSRLASRSNRIFLTNVISYLISRYIEERDNSK